MTNSRTGDTWYAVAPSRGAVLHCARCSAPIPGEAIGADHHPSACPTCGVESLFFPWHGRAVQLLPDDAPPPVSGMVRWAQDRLDELEFVELLVSLAELAAAIGSDVTTAHKNGLPTNTAK